MRNLLLLLLMMVVADGMAGDGKCRREWVSQSIVVSFLVLDGGSLFHDEETMDAYLANAI